MVVWTASELIKRLRKLSNCRGLILYILCTLLKISKLLLFWLVFGSLGFFSLARELAHLIDVATSLSDVSDKLVRDHLDPVGLFPGKT